MRTKNAMQLKARINSRAKEAGIPPQSLMQSYLLERLLARLSKSAWREIVIVKGGMLISSLVGIASRTTMDLDTTVRGLALTHDSIESVFRDVISVESDDDWAFEFVRTEDIRETDDYPGIRVHLIAKYPPMSVPLTIDVTTGDAITPAPVEYEYPLLFDDDSIQLMAYPLETVLAEKLETVISRGVTNTRPRDFYDIHTLWMLARKGCSLETLREALEKTSVKRGSQHLVKEWRTVLQEVEDDEPMLSLWAKYAKKTPYVADLSLQDCCASAREILESIV